MTHDTVPAYGLWGLVIINTAVFVIFAFSSNQRRAATGVPLAPSRPSSSRCSPRDVRLPAYDLPPLGMD